MPARTQRTWILVPLCLLAALEAWSHTARPGREPAFTDAAAGARPRPNANKKPKRPPRKELDDFEVGEQLQGQVKAWLGMNGYIVDVQGKLNAHLEACEMADGFPEEFLEKGDWIDVRVLDMSEAEKRFHLTMRPGDLERPTRRPLLRRVTEEDVQRFVRAVGDNAVEGEVTQFAFYGVFVRCKQPDLNGEVEGLIHKKNFGGDFAKTVARGQKVKVRIQGSEGKKLFLEPAED